MPVTPYFLLVLFIREVTAANGFSPIKGIVFSP
jgi:hypothetical protein